MLCFVVLEESLLTPSPDDSERKSASRAPLATPTAARIAAAAIDVVPDDLWLCAAEATSCCHTRMLTTKVGVRA